MTDKVKIKLKQVANRNRIGGKSSISQGGKRKFVTSLPIKFKVTMKQQARNNRGITARQGGSIKIREV